MKFCVSWRKMSNSIKITVENVKRGYTGNDPGVKIWTFSAALMFSLTVFTTIGKSGTFYHIICCKYLLSHGMDST